MLLTPPSVTNCHTFSDTLPLERDVLYGRLHKRLDLIDSMSFQLRLRQREIFTIKRMLIDRHAMQSHTCKAVYSVAYGSAHMHNKIFYISNLEQRHNQQDL